MTTRKEQCSQQIFTGSWISPRRPCSRRGVVKRNGRFYCKQHDPERKSQRLATKAHIAELREAKWRADRQVSKCRDAVVAAALAWWLNVESQTLLAELADRCQQLVAAEQLQRERYAELEKALKE